MTAELANRSEADRCSTRDQHVHRRHRVGIGLLRRGRRGRDEGARGRRLRTAPRATSSRSSPTTPSPASRASETLERPLTLLLDEALHTPELGGALREAADPRRRRPLLVRLLRRPLRGARRRRELPIGIGTHAYGRGGLAPARAAARRTTRSSSTSSASSRRTSARFVDVAREVADATIAHGRRRRSRRLLKLYERWLKTGSERLASADSQGFVADARRRPRASCSERRRARGSSRCASCARERRGARARAARSRAASSAGSSALYQLDRAADVDEFVDARRRGEREALLVREADGRPRAAAPLPRLGARTSTSRRRPRPALPDHRGRQPLRLPRGPRARASARRRSSSSSSRPRSTSTSSSRRARCAGFDERASAALRERLYERVAFVARRGRPRGRALSRGQRLRAPLHRPPRARLRDAGALRRAAGRAAQVLPHGPGREAPRG